MTIDNYLLNNHYNRKAGRFEPTFSNIDCSRLVGTFEQRVDYRVSRMVKALKAKRP